MEGTLDQWLALQEASINTASTNHGWYLIEAFS